MVRSFVMLLWIGLILCAVEQSFGQQMPGTIRSVSHTAAQGEERIDISLEGPGRHEVFLIDGDNPRLVLDFPDYRYVGGSAIPVAGGVLVQSIRVGIHHKPQRKIRLVADLTRGHGISWHQDFRSDGEVLTITITSAAEDDGQSPAVSEETEPPAAVASPSGSEATPPKMSQPEPEAAPQQIKAESRKIRVSPKPVIEQPQETQEDDSKVRDASPVVEQRPEPPQEPPQEPPAAPAEVPEAQADAAPVLLSVSFDNAFSHSGEMVLLQLSDFRPPEITTREKEPPGIICNFAGAEIDEGVPKEIKAGGRYVDRVLVVGEEGGVRVILDLVPGRDYDLQQVYFKEDNLFVLIVNLLEE